VRIAVDARQVFRANPRGIGKTTAVLYAHLAAQKPDWQFNLIYQVFAAAPAGLVRDNIVSKCVDIPGGDRFGWWESLRLPAAVRSCDVLHCPANTGPRFPLRPMVVTVHDLIPVELNPDAPETRAWRKAVATAANAARHIVTVSEYSKSQIVKLLNIRPEKITAIPHAPDPGLTRVTDVSMLDAVRAKYGLEPGEEYAFAFGASDPRKNTANVIRAYAALPENLRKQYRLLFVGIQDAARAQFAQLAAEMKVGERVRLHGYADEADLPALLSAGSALIFPSLSEGFGLPVLDAFACGLPVLTSDRTSLPEVAGGAAVLVDPTSQISLTAGLQKLLESDGLQCDLRAAGFARAAEFTWPRAAERLGDVLSASAR
jgi:glycosyltransferase involved in cell wall biosynthesis